MSLHPNDDYLERVKAEIRAEAEAARTRAPLPRIEPPPRAVAASAPASDGIERERLDYSIGELTGPDYRAFIDHAFRALLKRRPDDAGATLQIRLLAVGASKAEVLGNLRWSPEGRRIGTRVRGLLPRYALAKLARVPVLGYFIEWGLAFAGLPLLLRHQRAMDTVNAARFGEAADAQRGSESLFERIEAAQATLGAERDHRTDELRGEIGRLQRQLDDLGRHAVTLQARTHALDERAQAVEARARGIEDRAEVAAREARGLKNEIARLSHYVHAANHWLTSLQNSLAELEDAAAQEQAYGDALAASVAESANAIAVRVQRHRDWSAALAARVPSGAQVLDLGSGDGGWVEALAARGLVADGVEANADLVARAQQRRVAVALGDPADALARCAAASLGAITLSDGLLDSSAAMARLFADSKRALKPGGAFLLRIETEPHRFAPAVADSQARAALLEAAGFEVTGVLPANGASAVLAQRGAT